MGSVIAGLVALAVAAWVPATVEYPHERDPDTIDEIVVNGVAPEAIERYVDSLVVSRRRGRANSQIARWTEPLCIKTIGGRSASNNAFTEQVTAAVEQFGVETKKGRCSPNVMLVATQEPATFARLFTDRYRNRFFQTRRSEYTPFLEDSGPVRWAHSIEWSGASATELTGVVGRSATDLRSVSLPNTRLTLSTAASIRRSLIVIDQKDIEVPQKALAAYVAFSILVELPRDFDSLGQDSILNLFRSDGGVFPLEPTPWDLAFVQSVYASSGFLPENVQRTVIADRMQRVLAQSVSLHLPTSE